MGNNYKMKMYTLHNFNFNQHPIPDKDSGHVAIKSVIVVIISIGNSMICSDV